VGPPISKVLKVINKKFCCFSCQKDLFVALNGTFAKKLIVLLFSKDFFNLCLRLATAVFTKERFIGNSCERVQRFFKNFLFVLPCKR